MPVMKDSFKVVCEQLRNAEAPEGSYLLVGSDMAVLQFHAVAMAKALNCTQAHEAGADESCSICSKIDKQIHPDIAWIHRDEGASRIKIEHVRGLIGAVNLKAYEGRCKVGIISYAEYMSEEAANCFLKTLEEPPRNTVFILLAEHPDTMLSTIRSRCKLFRCDDSAVFDDLLPVEDATLAFITEVFEKSDADRDRADTVISELLGWFRDILIVQTGSQENNLINPERSDMLKEKAVCVSAKQVLATITALVQARLSLREHYANPKLVLYNLKINYLT